MPAVTRVARPHLTVFVLVAFFMVGPSVSPARGQGLGYGIAGPAGVTGFFAISASEFHAAGGGELRAASRVGAGGEFGVFGSSRVLLVLSLNGTVYLGSDPSANRAVPFLSTGYSRFGVGDSDGPFNAWNVAGGLDYWARRRAGLRFELRDHVRLDTRGTVQYWSFRGGIVFK